jgi:hypothetical protein
VSLVPADTDLLIWEFAINDDRTGHVHATRTWGDEEAAYQARLLEMFVRRAYGLNPDVVIAFVFLWKNTARPCWPKCANATKPFETMRNVLQKYPTVSAFAVDLGDIVAKHRLDKNYLFLDHHHVREGGQVWIAGLLLHHLLANRTWGPGNHELLLARRERRISDDGSSGSSLRRRRHGRMRGWLARGVTPSWGGGETPSEADSSSLAAAAAVAAAAARSLPAPAFWTVPQHPATPGEALIAHMANPRHRLAGIGYFASMFGSRGLDDLSDTTSDDIKSAGAHYVHRGDFKSVVKLPLCNTTRRLRYRWWQPTVSTSTLDSEGKAKHAREAAGEHASATTTTTRLLALSLRLHGKVSGARPSHAHIKVVVTEVGKEVGNSGCGGGGGGESRAVLHADAPILDAESIPDEEGGGLLHVGGLPACGYYVIPGVTPRMRALDFAICRREQSAGVGLYTFVSSLL